MMDSFTPANLQTLIADRTGPCVSIFTRTHRGGDKQGPIRWKHQLDEAEKRLVAIGMCSSDAADVVDAGRALLNDLEFWRNTSDGLAGFFTPGIQQIFRLPIAFENETVVGPRFQIKPLLSWFAGDGKEDHALAQYRQLAGTGKTLRDATQILPAAQRGTLETLLLVPGCHVWGKYNLATGFVDVNAGPLPGNEDLSNLAAVFMLRHGRSVLTVSQERAFDGAPIAGLLFRALPHHGK